MGQVPGQVAGPRGGAATPRSGVSLRGCGAPLSSRLTGAPGRQKQWVNKRLGEVSLQLLHPQDGENRADHTSWHSPRSPWGRPPEIRTRGPRSVGRRDFGLGLRFWILAQILLRRPPQCKGAWSPAPARNHVRAPASTQQATSTPQSFRRPHHLNPEAK